MNYVILNWVVHNELAQIGHESYLNIHKCSKEFA